MSARLLTPNPTNLPADNGILREPARPIERRVDNFMEKFDFTTLSFDAFFTDCPGKIVLLGPSFLNLSPMMAKAIVTALPSRARCEFRIRNMDRHSQMWIDVPTNTTQIVIESDLGHFDITPSANLSHLFEGKRVLLTLSKNNRLEWIQDWVRYNRDIHGANAVLFYDNQSTIYSTDELLAALGAISDLDQVCVVSWPFKYGPLGFGYLDYWDSNFCQYGALEHARWMFLQRARSALNSDIDELIVSKNGQSVFEAAERASTGMVAFHGVWVYGFVDKTIQETFESPIRYTAFDHFLTPSSNRVLGLFQRVNTFPTLGGMLNTKWAVVPRKNPANAQWTVHQIYGLRGLYTKFSIDHSFCYRHYREINDNWRELTDNWRFDRAKRESFDPARFAYDREIVANFSRVRWSA